VIARISDFSKDKGDGREGKAVQEISRKEEKKGVGKMQKNSG